MSGIQNYKNATDITDQGIVDGRAVGQQPASAPVTVDTYIDQDASQENGQSGPPYDRLPGATSRDVSESTGQPGTGMSSKELRHDGQPGRKREKLGLDQYGTKSKDVES
ncbi:hypothetical protein C8R44DRAFT_84466 [Mycena epipterygia]|nr:hypothetical protein C8R44DRAFT_84466 [Mycena epipterygia]